MFGRLKSSARKLDPIELAWAAGFFDGEGSAFARTERARPGYRRFVVSVPQSGADRAPEVLVRFQSAVAAGAIGPRDVDGVYRWRASGSDARSVIALLSPHLGAVKRRQASAALRDMGLGPDTRRLSRAPRSADGPEERAWAAGFIDAEGCFGLVRAAARADGTRWYRIRASASQRGAIGLPPEVLGRLCAAVGIGRIEMHGDADDFKWVVQGEGAVREVLSTVDPYLGAVKRQQAARALAGFLSQRRFHGDRNRCARGHTYDYRTPANGRSRAVCLTCARLRDRAKRAAAGVLPRQFRDVTRRYTQ